MISTLPIELHYGGQRYKTALSSTELTAVLRAAYAVEETELVKGLPTTRIPLIDGGALLIAVNPCIPVAIEEVASPRGDDAY